MDDQLFSSWMERIAGCLDETNRQLQILNELISRDPRAAAFLKHDKAPHSKPSKWFNSEER